uniref:Uncharacterized protein n=1 Tax=Romanomermis culicivorax TaxID=13658 RepID=A0A915HQP1_ROMCU
MPKIKDKIISNITEYLLVLHYHLRLKHLGKNLCLSSCCKCLPTANAMSLFDKGANFKLFGHSVGNNKASACA